LVDHAGVDQRRLPCLDGVPSNAEELRQQVFSMVSTARKILSFVIDHYPDTVSREEIGTGVGLESTTGHFKNELGELRTLPMSLGLKKGGRLLDEPALFVAY
jgi:hypothetical protein